MTTRTDLYPSRRGERTELSERLDPVVVGEHEGPLDPELLTAFEDDGFLIFPKLFNDEEIGAVNAEVDRLAADPSVLARPQAIVEPDSAALRSIFEVHALSDVFARLVGDPRVVDVARQLL